MSFRCKIEITAACVKNVRFRKRNHQLYQVKFLYTIFGQTIFLFLGFPFRFEFIQFFYSYKFPTRFFYHTFNIVRPTHVKHIYMLICSITRSHNTHIHIYYRYSIFHLTFLFDKIFSFYFANYTKKPKFQDKNKFLPCVVFFSKSFRIKLYLCYKTEFK